MNSVFVSYSRKNKDFAKKLVERLHTPERDVWIDWEDIPWTADWWQEIRDGIERSDSFVFILSPASLSSLVCNLEIAHALDNNKRIVPIVLEEADHKTALEQLTASPLDDVGQRILSARDLDTVSRNNWQFLARHNWIFFNGTGSFEQGYKHLEEAIDTDLEHVRNHTQWLVRARQWEMNGRDRSVLLSGTQLKNAERWLGASGDKEPHPTNLHTEFIFESRQNASLRQRNLLLGVSTALVLTVALAILAAFMWRQAVAQRDRADQEARVARSGLIALQSIQDTQMDTALLLSAESVGVHDSLEARSILLNTVQYVQRLERFYYDHVFGVLAADYSPDGNQYATADADGMLLLWDGNQHTLITAIHAHDSAILALAYHPQGDVLASADEDGNILLWDAQTAEVFAETTTSGGEIYSLAFSPDGTLLASGHEDSSVHLWDAETLDHLVQLDHHTDSVTAVAFSPDGTMLASGGYDALITLWDIPPDETPSVRQEIQGQGRWVLALDFSPDGAILAAGDLDGFVQLWDMQTGEVFGNEQPEHQGPVQQVSFSQDGEFLITAGDDGTLILRNTTTGEWDTLEGHSSLVRALAVSPDGEHIISGDLNGYVLLWNTRQHLFSHQVGSLQEGSINAIAYSPDGTMLLTGDAAGHVTLWDLAREAPASDPIDEGMMITSVAFSPDGTKLAYGVGSGRVVLRHASSGEIITVIDEHRQSVNDIAFSPDNQWLASASEDGTVRLWDSSNGEQVSVLQDETTPWAIAFNPDSTLLAVGSSQGTITLWALSTLTRLRELDDWHWDSIYRLAFSHSGEILASASFDNTILLWDVESGDLRGRPLAGHWDWVLSMDFAPDDSTLVSGSRDTTIILWNVETHQQIGHAFIGHTDWVMDVEFSPDGKTLASGGRDGQLLRWTFDVNDWIRQACEIANRELTADERASYLADTGAQDVAGCG